MFVTGIQFSLPCARPGVQSPFGTILRISRVFVTAGRGEYLEVRYADMRRPAISLFEHRAALQAIRAEGQRTVSEAMIF